MADDIKKAKTAEQVGKLEVLQDLLLDDLIKAFRDNTVSATDRATVIRLLQSNGWALDPASIPSDLKDKLTSKVRFDDDLSTDETGAPKRMRIV